MAARENALEVADDGLPMVLKGLNSRQSNFAKQLALYDNPLKAHRLAGFSVAENSAAYAYSLAADVRIIAAVEYWKEVFSASAHTQPEKILANLSLMANMDTTSYFNNDWSLKPLDELDEQQKLALTGVEIVEKSTGRTIKLKFSKLEANIQLARIHRMGEDDADKRAGLNLTIQLGQQVNVSTPNVARGTLDNDVTIELSQ